MNVQQFLKQQEGRPPLTYDELNHDDPHLKQDPLSSKSDEHFASVGALVEEHPIPSAGIRR
jgi:hypothetical protein